MKNFLTLLICVFYFVLGFSQAAPTERVLTKSGEIYEGIIIEQVPGNYLSILLFPKRDTVNLSYSDIERISKILPETNENVNQSTTNKFSKPDLCFNCRKTYVMIFAAAGQTDEAMLATGLSFGYNIRRTAQIGLGAQVFYTLLDNTDRIFMPITLDLRYIFAESRTGRSSFLLGLSPGYNISIFESKTNYKQGHGLYISGTFGCRLNITPNFGLMLDVGYVGSGSAISSKITGEFVENSWTHHPMIRGTIFF